MKALISSLLIFFSNFSVGQQFSTVPFIHSHNDYLQKMPFLEALEAGAKSIEVDLFLVDEKLFPAHTKKEINKENTLESLYILPLKKYLAEEEEIHRFHLMIDIKSEAVSTLAAIEKTLKRYPEIFSKEGIQVVISGSRPEPENYKNYADFIWFDGREPSDAEKPGGNKVAIISQNLSKFTHWRGEGEIPEKEKQELINFISACHSKGKTVRFWNTGDNETMYNFMYSIGADYINDSPKAVQNYLQNCLKGQELPAWQEGYFDIHHINTGRGNASFLTFPDGTTMLIDMGDMSETHPRTLSKRNTPALPNNSKSPAQWVADYLLQFNQKKETLRIDYTLITHYHDDHFGELDATKTKHEKGNYALTGIMELGSIIPVKKIIDRGSSFPIDFKDEKTLKKFNLLKDDYSMIQTLEEYWKFIEYQKQFGLKYEEFEIGSTNQFKLLSSDKYDFKVRNLFANGKISDESGNIIFEKFKTEEYPGENNLSTGIKITYGNFDYYTGGDISGIDGLGQTDKNSMESKAAPVIGAVDAAALNHHGNRDSQNPDFVAALQPRIWLQPSWSSDHPGEDVLRRITSKALYPGQRDIFSTSILEANKLVIGDRINHSYKATEGHIVVRVYPGGKNYTVFVLNDKNTKREIVKYFNYESR